ncbi:MAG: response regulator [Deltaproteobacteria bacterium]|nr:response regulator [Deltaproteobacteria bacterium]
MLRENIKGTQERYEYKISEISVLHELGQAVINVHDFNKLCEKLLDIIINNTIAQNCSIMFLDNKNKGLYLVCATDVNKQTYIIDPKKVLSKDGVRYIPGADKGAAGKALKDNAPVLIENTAECNFFSSNPETQVEIKSLLSVPMKIDERVRGVINLSHSAPDIFKKHDVYLFRIIADLAGSAIYSSINYNKVQSSEMSYRDLVENSNNGIAIIQNEAHIYANPKYQELTGYTWTELKALNLKKLIDFSYQMTDINTLLEGLKDHSHSELFNARILKKKGPVLDVEISASSLLHYGRRILVVSMQDISDRKILEKQLIHAQKMQSMGTLAAGIAHNFNNLLMGIQGNASVALLDMKDDNPIYKNLTNIERLVKNGSNLTSQLLGYAREGKCEIKPINLNLIVKETSETFGSARKDIQIILDLEDNLAGVKADQGQIEQTFLNLYINAADAMPEGGTLTIKTSNVTDKEIGNRNYRIKPGNYVLITVRDTGTGIDPKIIDRVFEPFFTTKGLVKGTGLGLASAYGIIKGHGGYIDVASIKGKETTFSIYIPSTKESIRKEEEMVNDLYTGTGTILLVDDEEIIIYAGEQMLRKLGFKVIVAENGKDAIEIFRKDHKNIDMVLLDMVMPGLGGEEIYNNLKNIDGSVKVLLSSGYSLDGQAGEIMKKGCNGFIQKPFTLNNLSQKLKEVLDN